MFDDDDNDNTYNNTTTIFTVQSHKRKFTRVLWVEVGQLKVDISVRLEAAIGWTFTHRHLYHYSTIIIIIIIIINIFNVA